MNSRTIAANIERRAKSRWNSPPPPWPDGTPTSTKLAYLLKARPLLAIVGNNDTASLIESLVHDYQRDITLALARPLIPRKDDDKVISLQQQKADAALEAAQTMALFTQNLVRAMAVEEAHRTTPLKQYPHLRWQPVRDDDARNGSQMGKQSANIGMNDLRCAVDEPVQGDALGSPVQRAGSKEATPEIRQWTSDKVHAYGASWKEPESAEGAALRRELREGCDDSKAESQLAEIDMTNLFGSIGDPVSARGPGPLQQRTRKMDAVLASRAENTASESTHTATADDQDVKPINPDKARVADWVDKQRHSLSAEYEKLELLQVQNNKLRATLAAAEVRAKWYENANKWKWK